MKHYYLYFKENKCSLCPRPGIPLLLMSNVQYSSCCCSADSLLVRRQAGAAATSAAVVVITAITYAICLWPVVRAVTAAVAIAAEAQVQPAADGAGFPFHRLLRAAFCQIRKSTFACLSWQLVTCLLKISVESINLVWGKRFCILKGAVDRSLNCM